MLAELCRSLRRSRSCATGPADPSIATMSFDAPERITPRLSVNRGLGALGVQGAASVQLPLAHQRSPRSDLGFRVCRQLQEDGDAAGHLSTCWGASRCVAAVCSRARSPRSRKPWLIDWDRITSGRPAPAGAAVDTRAGNQGTIWLIRVPQLPRTPRVIVHVGSAAYC